MSLVVMLLSESLDGIAKGGPGSGPHSNESTDSKQARYATDIANMKTGLANSAKTGVRNAHLAAAKANSDALDANLKAGNAAQASFHQKAAEFHNAVSQLGRKDLNRLSR